MRPIRYTAALLILLAGVLHLLPVFTASHDTRSLVMLVFGILYVATGILLLLDLRYSALPGIIFPMMGIVTGFFIIGNNLNPLLAFLFVIDVVVVICCIFLFVKRKK